MQSYEEPPPPYPGTESNIPPQSMGNYKGVPVYEVGPNLAPVYGQRTYQQQQPSATPAGVTLIQTHPVQVGRRPVRCICPQCHEQIVTQVDYESGSFAWLMCLLLTIIGCIPCCVIPFCASSCQDATHTCPHCSALVARRKVL